VHATAESTIDPAIPSPLVNAALADDLFTTVVKVLLMIPFVFAFLGVVLVISAIQNFFYNSAGAVAASALTSAPSLSDSAPITPATGGPEDGAPVTEAGKADDSRWVASMQTATGSQQKQTDMATSTKHVTDRVEAEEAPTGLTAASASEPSAYAPASEPAKPATPRPVVRGSTELRQQLPDLSHPGDSVHSTAGTAAAGDEGTTAGSSSVASSSAASTGSKSARGDSSSDDAGDS
jgi:hypothetical protein